MTSSDVDNLSRKSLPSPPFFFCSKYCNSWLSFCCSSCNICNLYEWQFKSRIWLVLGRPVDFFIKVDLVYLKFVVQVFTACVEGCRPLRVGADFILHLSYHCFSKTSLWQMSLFSMYKGLEVREQAGYQVRISIVCAWSHKKLRKKL